MVRVFSVFVLLAALFGSTFGLAQSQSSEPSDVHLGVATCAGTPCHGAASTTKKNSSVLQNEYLVWQKSDKHAKAFTALESELGKRIAANLGLGPADKATVCLACHTDNVPPERRGVKFALEDGVGCEACHGASEAWLGPHIAGHSSHAELVKEDGLFPTEDPMARAQLCLGCHLGDSTRVITHKMMGAGHPRLAFELQTFSQIEPAHFVVDDIYRRRKTAAAGVTFWAVGQAVALERLVSGLADETRRGQGVFPELVFFDCQACHHPMSNLRWHKRDGTGLGPGVPRFNDANAIMLSAIAGRVAPDLGHALDADVRALHQALSAGQGDPAEIARRLAGGAHRLAEILARHDFSKSDLREMAGALAAAGRRGDLSSYAAAEQATMAFAAIIDTLKTDGALDAAPYGALKSALARCYAATQHEEAFDPAAFDAAAQSILQAFPTW